MGLYIETENQAAWIEEYAQEILFGQPVADEELVIFVADNISFKAYAVAFDERERIYLSRPDERDIKWYKAKKEDLKRVCPKWDLYTKKR